MKVVERSGVGRSLCCCFPQCPTNQTCYEIIGFLSAVGTVRALGAGAAIKFHLGFVIGDTRTSSSLAMPEGHIIGGSEILLP